MTKLTNWNREQISRKAVQESFAERMAALAATEDTLAREAYDLIIPPAEQKLIAKVPSNWFRKDACLQFNVGGQRITLRASEGLPVPYARRGKEDEGSYGCNVLGVIEPGDLCDRIQAHALAVEEMKAARREADRKVKTLVQSVTTINKLKEVWPEGAPFYASPEKMPVALPAVRVEDVNAALGLAA